MPSAVSSAEPTGAREVDPARPSPCPPGCRPPSPLGRERSIRPAIDVADGRPGGAWPRSSGLSHSCRASSGPLNPIMSAVARSRSSRRPRTSPRCTPMTSHPYRPRRSCRRRRSARCCALVAKWCASPSYSMPTRFSGYPRSRRYTSRPDASRILICGTGRGSPAWKRRSRSHDSPADSVAGSQSSTSWRARATFRAPRSSLSCARSSGTVTVPQCAKASRAARPTCGGA